MSWWQRRLAVLVVAKSPKDTSGFVRIEESPWTFLLPGFRVSSFTIADLTTDDTLSWKVRHTGWLPACSWTFWSTGRGSRSLRLYELLVHTLCSQTWFSGLHCFQGTWAQDTCRTICSPTWTHTSWRSCWTSGHGRAAYSQQWQSSVSYLLARCGDHRYLWAQSINQSINQSVKLITLRNLSIRQLRGAEYQWSVECTAV